MSHRRAWEERTEARTKDYDNGFLHVKSGLKIQLLGHFSSLVCLSFPFLFPSSHTARVSILGLPA